MTVIADTMQSNKIGISVCFVMFFTKFTPKFIRYLHQKINFEKFYLFIPANPWNDVSLNDNL